LKRPLTEHAWGRFCMGKLRLLCGESKELVAHVREMTLEPPGCCQFSVATDTLSGYNNLKEGCFFSA
jgi:hypothetical protein